MRTKTLLLTAALSAAGIATSMAQVYSVNAVGYVNTPLVEGFNLISNPLRNTEANGNQIQNLFNSLPGSTIVYLWNGAGFDQAEKDPDFGWGPANIASRELLPGSGAFVRINTGAGAQTVTFVGEVPQGSLSTPLVAGFNLVSSQVPQEGTVTALGYPGKAGDILFFWTGTGYSQHSWDADFNEWNPALPTVDVGEAFFLRKTGTDTWTRTFSVNG